MQLRMSPGGSMLNSLRRRPLEPPSSLTVTTAQSSVINGWPGFGRGVANCLSPFSRVERPVPPPMATTRYPADLSRENGSGYGVSLIQVFLAILAGIAGFGKFRPWVRVEQFGEGGIFDQVLKIGIVTCLKTKRRIHTDGFIQVAQGVLGMASEAVEGSHAVGDVVRIGHLFQE